MGTSGITSGATNTTLTINNAQTNNSGSYSVIVTNYGGSVTSSIAVLTVTNVPPAITVQPTSQTNGVGTTATLAVTATGTAPLSYQWQVNGTNLVNGGQGDNNGDHQWRDQQYIDHQQCATDQQRTITRSSSRILPAR